MKLLTYPTLLVGVLFLGGCSGSPSSTPSEIPPVLPSEEQAAQALDRTFDRFELTISDSGTVNLLAMGVDRQRAFYLSEHGDIANGTLNVTSEDGSVRFDIRCNDQACSTASGQYALPGGTEGSFTYRRASQQGMEISVTDYSCNPSPLLLAPYEFGYHQVHRTYRLPRISVDGVEQRYPTGYRSFILGSFSGQREARFDLVETEQHGAFAVVTMSFHEDALMRRERERMTPEERRGYALYSRGAIFVTGRIGSGVRAIISSWRTDVDGGGGHGGSIPVDATLTLSNEGRTIEISDIHEVNDRPEMRSCLDSMKVGYFHFLHSRG